MDQNVFSPMSIVCDLRRDALTREGVTVFFLCPDYVAFDYEKKKVG
jgi:hypothetical protein